jgi:hypothetical protein
MRGCVYLLHLHFHTLFYHFKIVSLNKAAPQTDFMCSHIYLVNIRRLNENKQKFTIEV